MHVDHDRVMCDRWKDKRTILNDCEKKNPMLK